ncbi:hypothetical protein SAMN06272721_12045 [Arthrobacter sp. P2b]|nr:hypothetical protein SAMN06272721_12045 [Arthrobacter sp. P2b]
MHWVQDHPHRRRRCHAITAAVAAAALAATLFATGSAAEAAPPVKGEAPEAGFELSAVSTRADLVTGGDVLMRVNVPPNVPPHQVTVTVNGRDVTDAFGPDPQHDLALLGLVDGLELGENKVVAKANGKGLGRPAAQLTVTNHPIGGPVFSGPQIQPWACTTEEIGLGAATDAQCNAPARYEFFYMDVDPPSIVDEGPGLRDGPSLTPYDPQNPPPAEQIQRITTDEGKTLPYIVRVETGTANRGIYDVATLFDPAKPWESQEGWNGKLYFVAGCGQGTGHTQGTQRTCANFAAPERNARPDHVLVDHALSRGFAVAASTLTNRANNTNTVVMAETLMMVKEHIVENYGPIRYTIGFGASGGSQAQNGIANQYPGLLDGLTMPASFPDVWASMNTNAIDCPLLNNYFNNTSPELWPDVGQKDLVYGFGVGHPGESGTAHCAGPDRPTRLWEPTQGGALTLPPPCVSADEVYNPETNPTGVRCSVQDYMVNVFGSRPASDWGPIEAEIGKGFANRFLDRVGLQYGLQALEQGAITPAQFVDLNKKVGGWDIDSNWQAERTMGDPAAVAAMYRTGQLVEGKQLANVAIIDYRHDVRGPDVHTNRASATMRERLIQANGTDANRAEWLGPRIPSELWRGETAGNHQQLNAVSFQVMDEWLTAVEVDRSDRSLAEKIIDNRPASAADGCFAAGQRIDDEMCADYALDSDPLLAAGMPETSDVLKCQLKPLERSEYNVTFTDEQWGQLKATFPSGVCDWTKPGVSQTLDNIPWLSYGPAGGEPLGPPPTSVPVKSDAE